MAVRCAVGLHKTFSFSIASKSVVSSRRVIGYCFILYVKKAAEGFPPPSPKMDGANIEEHNLHVWRLAWLDA
jgi:hypothetical protein